MNLRTVGFVVVALLVAVLLFDVLSPYVSAGSIPQPGSSEIGEKWQKSKKKIHAEFYANEAYPEWAAEPYIYMTSVFAGVKNQEVKVKVRINITLNSRADGVGDYYGYLDDDDGREFNGYDSAEFKNKMRAQIIQLTGWRSEAENLNDSRSGFIKPVEVTAKISAIHTSYVSALFIFDTNTSAFRAGIFAVQMQVKVVWYDWWNPFTPHYSWEDIITIYGKFSHGDIKNNPPSQDLENTGYTQISGHVYTGYWNIQFWYASSGWNNGTFDDYHTTIDGVVDEEGVAHMLRDYGTFSPDNPDYNLTYTFNESDPTGIYLWVFFSKYTDGTVLSYFSVVVHNNASSLSSCPYPKFEISFSGSHEIDENLIVHINVTNYNNTDVRAVIIAYYGAQLNFIPPENGGVAVLYFNRPIYIRDGTAEISMRMRSAGQLNIIVLGTFVNCTSIGFGENYTQIAGFQGAAGGTLNFASSWFIFPWESTVNLVILIIAVISILSSSNTMRTLGIILLFASMINWHLVYMHIVNGLTPWEVTL